jgi:hypothetical protein
MTPYLGRGFVAGKPLAFEVLVKAEPAPIPCDVQGWIIVAGRLDEPKKLI